MKIGDLGVSKIVGNMEQLSPSKVGTPSYNSPELINSRSYDYKIDIWAIGCCLYHLANHELPFTGNSLETLSLNITNARQKYLKKYLNV
jgi:NIMA (never in mitosis gene a)-related kinase